MESPFRMFNSQKVGAVIAAAGSSRRMGGQDKLFIPLGGRPALARVIDAFQKCAAVDMIILTISPANQKQAEIMAAHEKWSKLCAVIPGGDRRQDSVTAGMKLLNGCQWTIVQDGARPFVTAELIQQGLEAAQETGAAICAVPVTDTIKTTAEYHLIHNTPLRQTLWAAQTPQVFRSDIITEAYRRLTADVTDDAAAVEQMGGKVKLYMGNYHNIKITNPDDAATAEVLWRKYGR